MLPEDPEASVAERVEPARRSAIEPPPKAAPSIRHPRISAEEQAPNAGDPYPLWPANRAEGARGRLVRIGTFDSAEDARQAWNRILAEYPGMVRLKPIVVSGESLRDRRAFYRLQLGTSSQAHSAVLCDRSRNLGLSCSVLGLILGDSQ